MKKEELTIIDFSEFPEPPGDEFMMMPEDEFDRYELYCDYIQLATTLEPGAKIDSGFYCECVKEDGELCEGNVEVSQIDLPKQVRWKCKKCGDKGAIINYEYTAWDNSHLPDEEKQTFLEMVLSDVTAEDFFDDEMFLYEEEDEDELFDDFEYYVNHLDPDGERTGGPTSGQIRNLLDSDWTEPNSPLYLNNNISLEELERSRFFCNARRFLLLLQKEETFPLTRLGYLKRNSVKKLLSITSWDEPYVAEINKTKKHIDETDIWILYGMRLLLDMSELIETDNNEAYRINPEKAHLLREENAGELYRQLFSTYFREMNLGFFGSTFELPYLQYSIPFILYKLKTVATTWMPTEDFAEESLLFPVKVELDSTLLGESDHFFDMFYEDVLLALERFGLVETRKTRNLNPKVPVSYPRQVRVTPLIDKFLIFNELE